MQTLTSTKNDLLVRAKSHYFSLGIGDGASSLCRENFAYGLAKMQYAQEELGMTPNASFISTPDETITHNKIRWASGYGYGGKLVWGFGIDKVIFIDVKPNACGMLLGGLDRLPNPAEIIKNIDNILKEEQYVDDIKIKWDFKKGNHFIDVFATDPRDVARKGFPPYTFIIHCSSPELQDDKYRGLGIYYDKSENLRNMMKTIDTPFGEIHYIEGNDAKEYLEKFEYAKQFSAKRRELAAKLIFGPFKTISNAMHQGLTSYNEIVLGAQPLSENEKNLFPLALRSDLPAYIMRAYPNLTEEQIENLGFEGRAKRLGVYSFLRNFNTIPHGGGYKLPAISRVLEVNEYNSVRYFVCEQEAQEGINIITDTSELEYVYRGKKVVNKTEAVGLGKVEAHLNPKFILKI